MQAFLLALLRNLIISAILAWASYRLAGGAQQAEAPKPQKNDFAPTAIEGTEVKHLFGTGPVQMMVVAVMQKSTEAIRVG